MKLKMELEEKRTEIRYELELKMTEKGLDYVRQCNENQRKEEVSKAFNALRDITDPLISVSYTHLTLPTTPYV